MQLLKGTNMPCISNCLTSARENAFGLPVAPKKSTGVKWAVLAAIAAIATGILGLCTALSFVGGIATIASGVGISAGIFEIGSGVMMGMTTVASAIITQECIKNARHHLRARPLHT